MGNREHTHNHSESSKNIAIAFILNSVFAIIELIGGLMTNSIAILSDALHDFGDSLSLGVAFYLQKKSKKGRNRNYSYGYKRFSLLGSIFISSVLLISSFYIINESIKRVIEPQESNAQGMVLLAILGIIVNGAAVLKLRKGTSLNEKAVFLHLMEDVLGWIAVLVAGIVMSFINIPILDPILSIAITLWVLYNVYKNIKSTLGVLMQEVPKDIDQEQMISSISSLSKIIEVHDLHIWSLDGEHHILTLHVVVELDNCNEQDLIDLKCNIRKICSKYGVQHVTIEIEDSREVESCDYCR